MNDQTNNEALCALAAEGDLTGLTSALEARSAVDAELKGTLLECVAQAKGAAGYGSTGPVSAQSVEILKKLEAVEQYLATL